MSPKVPPEKGRKRAMRALRYTLGGLGGLALLAVGAALVRIATYVDPWHAKVEAAGYVKKTAQVGDVHFSYVEGPDNGPPLVLLHAQLMDWFSYSRVLPELAKSYHVFDIDYPGHGQTRVPANYPMTANRIGADLASFIETKIGQPVFVTGNSSGGLLATWLTARRPDLIRAAVLEDPPLFASEYPRIKRTIAYRAFRTSYTATADHPQDFLLYWIHQNAGFFRRNIAPGSPFALAQAVRFYHLTHPGKPAEIGLIPNDTIRLMVRGLDQYDPRFGAAFYDGTWNAGFDHAHALSEIHRPTLLLHADFSFLPDGTLYGAMDDRDAAKAMRLMKGGSFKRVKSGHVINLEHPEEFVRILNGFFKPEGPTKQGSMR